MQPCAFSLITHQLTLSPRISVTILALLNGAYLVSMEHKSNIITIKYKRWPKPVHWISWVRERRPVFSIRLTMGAFPHFLLWIYNSHNSTQILKGHSQRSVLYCVLQLILSHLFWVSLVLLLLLLFLLLFDEKYFDIQ